MTTWTDSDLVAVRLDGRREVPQRRRRLEDVRCRGDVAPRRHPRSGIEPRAHRVIASSVVGGRARASSVMKSAPTFRVNIRSVLFTLLTSTGVRQ